MVFEKDVRWMLDGQNLSTISKAVDVHYRTLWGWINESEVCWQRYDKAREEQEKMIKVKIDEVMDAMRQDDIQMVFRKF